ncbi:hypothetical protein SCA6_007104 [Theobroma cacao]
MDRVCTTIYSSVENAFQEYDHVLCHHTSVNQRAQVQNQVSDQLGRFSRMPSLGSEPVMQEHTLRVGDVNVNQLRQFTQVGHVLSSSQSQCSQKCGLLKSS